MGLVQVPFAGVDHLLDVMRNTSARWSNAAGLYDATVAESTIALLLAQLHAHKRVGTSWDNRDEVEAHTSFLFEDKTVAVVGAGGGHRQAAHPHARRLRPTHHCGQSLR